MAHERKCLLCGTMTRYCPHNCLDYDPTETWRFLYHDKNCLAISKIWYAYRGNEITKEEARKQMEEYPENIAMIMKFTSIPAKEIQAIFDMPEEITEEDKSEIVSNDTESEDKNIEDLTDNKSNGKQSFKNNYHKNHKK